MRRITADRRGGAALVTPWLRRQRFFTRRPRAGGGGDADNIGQAVFGDGVMEISVVALSGVRQHGFCLHGGGDRGAQLIQRDLRLGLKDNIIWHAGGRAPLRVIGPIARQIQPVRDWQAGVIIRSRQADRDLAIILLAKLPALLRRHTNRVPALLRHAGIVVDQGTDRTALGNQRQDTHPHRRQHRIIPPIGFRHEVVQRLVRRLHPAWLHARRHRFNAFAITRQQQSRTI